jgi:transcriptional regulator with XRE-family HTH domain
VALRLAHGWTQEQVACCWNRQWPPKGGSAGVTDKNISSWETWPQSGVEPSLKTLKRLAQLYQCDIGQLIEDGDYRHLDEANHQEDDDADRLQSSAAHGLAALSAADVTQSPNQAVALRDSRPSDAQIEAPAMLGAQVGERADGMQAPLEALTYWGTERSDKDLLADLTDRSQKFGEWAATTEVPDAVIGRYKDQVRCLARDFERAPPLPLLAETSQLCDRVTGYIRGHQRPDQARELYLLAAQLYGLLAWITGDLGRYRRHACLDGLGVRRSGRA